MPRKNIAHKSTRYRMFHPSTEDLRRDAAFIKAFALKEQQTKKE